METKSFNQEAKTLSPSNSFRTRNSDGCTNSPEFEFWMLRNPSFPQPNLLSADELFVDGVLMPLHLLNKTEPSHETPKSEPISEDPDPEPEPGPRPDSSASITEPSSSTFSASKRWKDIFRKGEKKNAENANNNNKDHEEKEKEKEKEKKKKKKERKGATGASSSAELNINIWPFSRSRSAGNTGTRPKLFPGAPTRKVNSAPCSRSNSAGESKSRKWPSSPGRAGVHVGRASPVWQVRRVGSKNSSESQPLNTDKGLKKQTPTIRRSKVSAGGGSGSAKARVLNLNVPMCIGYRHHLSCRSDENSAIGVSNGDAVNRGNNRNGGNDGDCNNDGGSGGNLFNLRNLFTKKSIVTSH